MKKLITILLLLFSTLSFGQIDLFKASPLAIIEGNKIAFSKPGIDNKVVKFIADEIKGEKFKNSLGLKKKFIVDEYFENACMPLVDETNLTIYHVVSYGHNDGTRMIIRFVPGNRKGVAFSEAASSRMLEVLKSLEKTEGAEVVGKKLSEILGQSESMRDNIICGIVVIDQNIDGIYFADIKTQHQHRGFKYVNPFSGNY